MTTAARLARALAVTLLLAALCPLPALAAEDRDALRALMARAVPAACPVGLDKPQAISAALDGLEVLAVEDDDRRPRLTRRWLAFGTPGGGELVLTGNLTSGQLLSLVVEAFEASGGERRPALMLRVDRTCTVVLAREIGYDGEGRAETLFELDAALARTGTSEPLNPAVPEGRDPGGLAVALVDSGVNYLLPEIAARLARDGRGRLLGYDFWERDARPFDGNPARSPFLPLRHGTSVASVLLREAPEARLVPFRYPRPDMSRMTELVAAAEEAGAGIVALAMGSANRKDWIAFEKAAEARPDMLFVVSAGNDGRDIDERPVYPASLALSNMLVVTSADDFGRLASGSNWGRRSVDLMVPAERLDALDHRGAQVKASGSSYAVPRVAALAARLWAANPDWTANTLKHAIFARAVVPRIRGQSPVREGWIPNPLDDGPGPDSSVEAPAADASVAEPPATELPATEPPDEELPPADMP